MQILKLRHPALHCKKNPIYVFPEMKLHGLIPNSFIYVNDTNFNPPLFSLVNTFKRNIFDGC
jgi:hypothetical protein